MKPVAYRHSWHGEDRQQQEDNYASARRSNGIEREVPDLAARQASLAPGVDGGRGKELIEAKTERQSKCEQDDYAPAGHRRPATRHQASAPTGQGEESQCKHEQKRERDS